MVALPTRLLAITALAAQLASCGREDDTPVQSQRIALDRPVAAQAEFTPAPDTEGADWHISVDGRGISWGKTGDAPLLSLECVLSGDEPPQIEITRHAPAPPGARAFFAVLGNGVNARLKVDAKLSDNEWRWEGSYPADAALLDVFTGPRNITATLPGGGMLQIDGSDLPQQFVTWCRNDGREQALEAEDEAGEADAPTEEDEVAAPPA